MSSLSLGPPVERFKPTNGMVGGYLGLAFAAFGIGYVALRVHTVTGLQLALGLAAFAVLVWVTQLRPRAVLHPHALVLRNTVTDTVVPLRLVDEVSVTRTLNVWAGDRRYVCIGIGRTLRAAVRGAPGGQGSGTGFVGGRRMEAYAESAERARAATPRARHEPAYETFVAERIEQAAEEARRAPVGDAAPAEVSRVPAWTAIAALAGTAAAFALSLLL